MEALVHLVLKIICAFACFRFRQDAAKTDVTQDAGVLQGPALMTTGSAIMAMVFLVHAVQAI